MAPKRKCLTFAEETKIRRAARRASTSCSHPRINVIGSEETGARTARCEACGVTLRRRNVGGTFEYFKVEG